MSKVCLGYGTPIALSILCLCTLAAAQVRAFDEDYKQNINGTRLHFRVRGTDKANPYLLILHGGPGFSAHMYYSWGVTLEKTVNVVYLDQRSCGESDRYHFSTRFVPTGDLAKDYTL